MKKTAFFLFVALVLSIFISCATTSRKFNEMRNICEKIEGNYEFTEAEFEKTNARFFEMVDKLESSNLSNEEQEELAQLKGRYVGAVTAKATKSLKNILSDELGNLFKGFVEGVSNSFNK
jgi:cell shape-determining protein MreC